MLSSETKRRIDACRDVLVGKLPQPSNQVELITLALIYQATIQRVLDRVRTHTAVT